MNSRQVRALVVGAVVGAVVGGFYAVVLVTYRDMIAAKQVGVGPNGKPCKGCQEKREIAHSPELSDAERAQEAVQREEFITTAEKARAIRAEHPDMRWQDAMKAAAASKNGVPETQSEVTE